MEHSKVVHLPTLSLLGFLLYLFMVLPSDYLGRVLAPSSLRLARLPPQVPPSPPQYPPYHPCSTYDVISFIVAVLGTFPHHRLSKFSVFCWFIAPKVFYTTID